MIVNVLRGVAYYSRFEWGIQLAFPQLLPVHVSEKGVSSDRLLPSILLYAAQSV